LGNINQKSCHVDRLDDPATDAIAAPEELTKT